ncbi:hypothetical protein [uncultured Bosea sp.]|uniref:hypothetical protein n=1 Tax=uncultured Bosea sp. TaxID=211457 RepID=UPI00263A9DC1|nr:hypothetical protein [uncultured Bosea sp.]
MKYNRWRGRITYIEIDPLLGALHYSEPALAEAKPEPLTIADEHLGPLIVSPDAPGNPRRTLAPPCAVTRTTAGER